MDILEQPAWWSPFNLDEIAQMAIDKSLFSVDILKVWRQMMMAIEAGAKVGKEDMEFLNSLPHPKLKALAIEAICLRQARR